MGLLYGRSSRPRPDSGLLWSIGLLLVSFPLMLVLLVVTVWLAPAFGVDLANPDPDELRALNLAYVITACLPLAAAAFLGFRAAKRGHRGGLVVTVLAVLSVVAFVLLPGVG